MASPATQTPLWVICLIPRAVLGSSASRWPAKFPCRLGMLTTPPMYVLPPTRFKCSHLHQLPCMGTQRRKAGYLSLPTLATHPASPIQGSEGQNQSGPPRVTGGSPGSSAFFPPALCPQLCPQATVQFRSHVPTQISRPPGSQHLQPLNLLKSAALGFVCMGPPP